jgi:hypothetical protein
MNRSYKERKKAIEEGDLVAWKSPVKLSVPKRLSTGEIFDERCGAQDQESAVRLSFICCTKGMSSWWRTTTRFPLASAPGPGLTSTR